MQGCSLDYKELATKIAPILARAQEHAGTVCYKMLLHNCQSHLITQERGSITMHSEPKGAFRRVNQVPISCKMASNHDGLCLFFMMATG